MTTLDVADPLALKDLAAFTSLAHRLDPDGAMRLHVSASVLVVTVAPLYPHGIGDSTPLVLAMRMLRLRGSELDGLDEVVPLTNLKDRFAREENGTSLPLPPNSVLVSWTGIAPPKGGWSAVDELSGEVLRRTAEAGIAEVSAGTPESAGSHAVKALRSRVWSKPMIAEAGTAVPGGLAFAAAGLRFVPESGSGSGPGSTAGPEQYPVMASPGWLRVVAPGGHLLTRSVG
ncbi:hypothetical protein DFO66_103415 [Brevibacterium sanguinis]|uniref:Uncharacterized protein n=2 Tax=Brevibacterium TaxID=1696 RepID=A0A366IL06_9MICO|nr:MULTISPECIES: hypothetical protein [Brevibacterium]RBP66465.1 hypothetical protein DFO66_103415 [Brevibacterium sanguinis]RBP73117.1 hypothetical protein DFO65_103415 [Brevibacterium celere]